MYRILIECYKILHVFLYIMHYNKSVIFGELSFSYRDAFHPKRSLANPRNPVSLLRDIVSLLSHFADHNIV